MLATINRLLDAPDLGRFILRVSFAGMLLMHGIAKVIHGVDGIAGMLAAHGLPEFIAYGTFAAELIAPIFLILGILSRLAAVVIAGNMIVAWLLADIAHTFTINAHGGWGIETVAVYFFAALAIVFLGGGKISVVRAEWR